MIYKKSKEFATRVVAWDWRQRAALLILIFHFLFPLRYYLWNDDPLDERFSWRMLSETSMADKNVKVTAIGWDTRRERFDVAKEMNTTTVQLLQFGHTDILNKFCDFVAHRKPWIRGAEVTSKHKFLDNREIRKKITCYRD